jgi:hypothetical protein
MSNLSLQRFTSPVGQTGVCEGYVPNYPPEVVTNKGATYLVVIGCGGFYYLYQGPNGASPFTFVRKIDAGNTLGFNDGLDQVPHWDPADSDKLWFRYGLSIRYYRPVENTVTVFFTMPTTFSTAAGSFNTSTDCGGACSLAMYDYCNFSDDFTHAGYKLIAGGTGIVYAGVAIDLTANGGTGGITSARTFTASGDFPVQGGPHNKIPATVCASPSGNYIYMEWNCTTGSNPGNCPTGHHGTEVFDWATMTKQRELGTGQGGTGTSDGVVHSDSGWGLGHTEVYVSSISLGTLTDSGGVDGTECYNTIRIDTGAQTDTCFARAFHGDQDTCGGACINNWHVSMRGSRALNGYALVSTFTQGFNEGTWTSPDTSATGVTPLTPLNDELFAMKLDNTGTVYRIAKIQTLRFSACYYQEPHASTDLNFQYVFWASNWRTVDAACTTNDSISSYTLTLPTGGVSTSVRGGTMIMGGQSVHQ